MRASQERVRLGEALVTMGAATPADILRRGYRLLVAIVVQGGIGYLQYELGIPPWLVILHIVGATTVVGLMTWFHLGLSAPVADLPADAASAAHADRSAAPVASP